MQEITSELVYEQSRCISHEMKNHLSICELYTEIIKKNLDKENIENESINNAIKCIKKSLKIMGNSLLDLKSLNNLKQERYDLKNILEQGVEMSKVYIHDKKINIKTHINESAEIFIDENKFLACVVNIIKNAIEAIDKHGEITISSTIKDDFAYIKFQNNGSPISKEKQNEIFKEGFTTKKTGSGLGLHICAKNLQVQNAELRLTKSDDKATEFEIKIPIIK